MGANQVSVEKTVRNVNAVNLRDNGKTSFPENIRICVFTGNSESALGGVAYRNAGIAVDFRSFKAGYRQAALKKNLAGACLKSECSAAGKNRN